MVKRREKEPASVEDLPVKEEEVERAAGGADDAEESVAGPLADADSKSVLAQVQRYQMRHQGVKGLAQQSDSGEFPPLSFPAREPKFESTDDANAIASLSPPLSLPRALPLNALPQKISRTTTRTRTATRRRTTRSSVA